MREALYERVLYEVISDDHLYNFGDERRNAYIPPGETIIEAMAATNHDALLDLASNQLESRYDKFECIFMAYFHQGNYKKLLELLYDHQEFETIPVQLVELYDKIIDQNDTDLLGRFIRFFETKKNDSNVTIILGLLWEKQKFETAKEIIDRIGDAAEKNALLLIHEIRNERHLPSSQSIEKTLEALFPKLKEKRLREHFLDLFSFCLNEFVKSYDSLSFLKNIVIAFEKAFKEETGSYWNLDIHFTRKLLDDLCEEGRFSDAEELVKVVESFKYYDSYINNRKLDYAKSARNKELHEEAIATLRIGHDEKIEKLGDMDTESKVDFSVMSPWQKSIERKRLLALQNCEEAIYHLMHGDHEEADRLILAMVTTADSILTPVKGSEEEGKEDKRSAQKPYKSLKRQIKEEFSRAGLLQFLPADKGWRDPIKDPNEKKADRQAFERERLKREQESNKENIKFVAEHEALLSKSVQERLLANDTSGAIECLNANILYVPRCGDYERAALILDHDTSAFPALFEKLCLNHKVYKLDGWQESWALFLVKAHQSGTFRLEEFGKLKDVWIKYLRNSELHMWEVSSFLIVLIRQLIASGSTEFAWEVYQQSKKIVGEFQLFDLRIFSLQCLSFFLNSSANAERQDGKSLAFMGAEPDEVSTEQEKICYWNSMADIALSFKDIEGYQKSIESMQSVIQHSEQPETCIRTWCREQIKHCLRDHHQIKNETEVFAKACDQISEKTNHLIFYMHVRLGMPGMEASPLIKKRHTSEKLRLCFFELLVENGYLSANTTKFLGKENLSHLEPLRQLLAQYQNEFNTVIDTLADTAFEVSEWKHVFRVLAVVGVVTPGIWRQAKSLAFNEMRLRELSLTLKRAQQAIFRNTPLPDDLLPELKAELIYTTFRPANMSCSEVRCHLDKIPDCSDHLEKYRFPEEGYDITIAGKKDVELRRNQTKEDSLDELQTTTQLPTGQNNDKNAQRLGRELCEGGRMKLEAIESGLVSTFAFLFSHDAYFTSLRSFNLHIPNERFAYLQKWKDFLDVYLPDNLPQMILSFFHRHPESTSLMWENFVKGISQPKKKANYERQLGIIIPEKPDEQLASELISRVIMQKTKSLKTLKKAISEEIKKYVSRTGEEITTAHLRLRAYVSKNQASFFAKASAGLCTADDIGSFLRRDHFHINLVDDNQQTCVGNLMAYEMSHKDKKVLLLRGFNPNTSLLKDIDPASYCNMMIEVAIGFAKENGFDAVYMSEPHETFHALSNRHEIKSHLMKEFGSRVPESCDYSITETTRIQKMFLIRNISDQTEPATVDVAA